MIRFGMVAAALAALGGCSVEQAANDAGGNNSAGGIETNLSALPGQPEDNIIAAPEPAPQSGNQVAAAPTPPTGPAEPVKETARNSAAPAPRQPDAALKAPPAPRPAPRDRATPPTPSPDPAPPPKGTCTPEHREMGHC
jgi:hypothetical protein